jgi:hypothetical protein
VLVFLIDDNFYAVAVVAVRVLSSNQGDELPRSIRARASIIFYDARHALRATNRLQLALALALALELRTPGLK